MNVVLRCPRGHKREHPFCDPKTASLLAECVARGLARCDVCELHVTHMEMEKPS